MNPENTSGMNQNTSVNEVNQTETNVNKYLSERTRYTTLYVPPIQIRKTKKRTPSRIVKVKKPKAKIVGKFVIKPGNEYAHIQLPVMGEEFVESTKS